MIPKALIEITEGDLLALIANGEPESKRMEYKRELPDNSDKGRVQILKSITAFANTLGGDLIYGMSAIDGVPKELVALSITSPDEVSQRLEQLSIAGVDPRLNGVQLGFVPLAAGGHVLVVRVHRSWSAPHRVTAGGHCHFYGRHSSGTYQLDVGELRQMFGLSEVVKNRIQNFRLERLMKHQSGEINAPMAAGVRVLLHLVPLQSFATDALIDVVSSEREKQFSPRISHGWNSRLCLEGRYTFNSDSQELVTSSVLLFRNAAVEFAYVYEQHLGDKIVPAFYYEREVVEALRNCFATLTKIGVAPPALIMLTLMDLTGAKFMVDGNFSRTRLTSDRDVMVIPEAYVETWEQDPAAVLRPVFDIVWNAFGLARSTSYDRSGRWLDRS